MANQAKNVNVSLTYRKDSGKYRVEWRDLDTYERVRKNVDKDENPAEELKKIRNTLENQLLDGDYDTKESRVRKYIQIKEGLRTEQINGAQIMCDDDLLSPCRIARRDASIQLGNARNGEVVVNQIDKLYREGKDDEARKLRILLNRSFKQAYDSCEKPIKLSRLDSLVSRQLGTIARRLDERHEKKGGTTYRDECITLLKQLSAKIEEWRASE